MATTIDLGARAPMPGPVYGMSASSAPADRVAAFRASSGTEWLAGRLRARQQHRAGRGPGIVRRAVLVGLAAIAWLAVTLWNIGREFGWHAAAMGCFVIAGFTVSSTLGWLVAGLAITWTRYLLTPEAPPKQQ